MTPIKITPRDEMPDPVRDIGYYAAALGPSVVVDGRIEQLREVHAKLRAMYEQIAVIVPMLDSASTDTAFAIGETAGVIAKAKALVGRDIDQASVA